MNKSTTLIIIGLLSNMTVYAKKSIEEQLNNCKSVSSNQARLACFDRIEAHSSEAKETTSIIKNSTPEFPTLLADLDEPNFFISYGNLDLLGSEFKSVLLGVGKRHQIKEFELSNHQRVAFNVFAQIRSQFDVDQLEVRNNRGGALINTDFSVGGELVQSLDRWNWKLSYTHKSTHLGDEFLIDNPNYLENRINLSYETLKWTANWPIGNSDIYAGLGLITRSEPGDLDKTMWQLGWQFQGDVLGQGIKPIGAINLDSWGAYNWNVNVKLRAGIEVSRFTETPFKILFEYQDGHSSYGQFFTEDLTFTGLTFIQDW